MNGRLKKYYVAVAVGAALFMLSAFYFGLFAGAAVKETFGMLSDCFLIPGFILAGIGGLSFIAFHGGYDIFGYGGSTLLSHFQPGIDRRFESYFDYKTRKEKERKPWLKELLIVGAVFVLLSVVMTVIYSVI